MLHGARRFLNTLKYSKDRVRLPKIEDMSGYNSPYSAIRRLLDYDYHTRPTNSRCLVQDTFISQHLAQPYSSRQDPLLLFTAGAMGAGKSHYLSTLPFKFILIDPDEIAATLPHFEPYEAAHDQALSKEAEIERGSRLRHEARLVTEVLLSAAMQQSYDIVIDGSLRSYQWYLKEIPKVRSRYLQYRVELVHIHAPLSVVLRRAEKRATQTGRKIPSSLIERSWKDSRRAISVLGRKRIVDRVQMIDSSGASPVRIYDSSEDLEWSTRGVPSSISPVDKFLEGTIENGDDLTIMKLETKL